MLVENYAKDLTEIRISKKTALLLINGIAHVPITYDTLRRNSRTVRGLIISKKVPMEFGEDCILKKNQHAYSFKFFILLAAYVKSVSFKRFQKFSPNQWHEEEITESMIKEINLEKLINSFKTKLPVKGQNLPTYFALEGIKVSKSSLYNYSKSDSSLPVMSWSKIYSPEEIEQWRQYLLNRSHQKSAVSEKYVAL